MGLKLVSRCDKAEVRKVTKKEKKKCEEEGTQGADENG